MLGIHSTLTITETYLVHHWQEIEQAIVANRLFVGQTVLFNGGTLITQKSFSRAKTRASQVYEISKGTPYSPP